jgi:uncharacterized protein YrrD
MIRAKDLCGRPVVDVDVAEKIGDLDEIILELDRRRVAGLMVSQGPSLIRGERLFLPAETLHSIGPDAITVRRPAEIAHQVAYLASLPRPSQIVGRKIVTESGRYVGAVADVLIDGDDYTLLGFAFGGAMGGVGALLGRGKSQARDYVRADSDFRVGHTLIVVPDEAVVRREKAPAAEPSPEPDVTVPTMEPRWVQTAPTVRTTRLRPATSAPVEWERH